MPEHTDDSRAIVHPAYARLNDAKRGRRHIAGRYRSLEETCL
jgi:hypothetical protein